MRICRSPNSSIPVTRVRSASFLPPLANCPAFSLLAGCGVLLIVHRAKFRPELNVILLAFGVCLTLASMFLAVHEATDNVPGSAHGSCAARDGIH